MLGQEDYGQFDWYGPVQPLDNTVSEPTLPDFNMDYLFGQPDPGLYGYATVGPDISYGQGADLGYEPITDIFAGMFDDVKIPTYDQYQIFNEPAGVESESFLSKLWGGIKDAAGALSFGGGGSPGSSVIAPAGQSQPVYQGYGQQPASNMDMGSLALLGGGAALLFVLLRKRGKIFIDPLPSSFGSIERPADPPRQAAFYFSADSDA